MASLREAMAHERDTFLDPYGFAEEIEVAEFGGAYRSILACVRRGGPEPQSDGAGEHWATAVDVEVAVDAVDGVLSWTPRMRCRIDGLEYVFARALSGPSETGTHSARFERIETDVEVSSQWRVE